MSAPLDALFSITVLMTGPQENGRVGIWAETTEGLFPCEDDARDTFLADITKRFPDWTVQKAVARRIPYELMFAAIPGANAHFESEMALLRLVIEPKGASGMAVGDLMAAMEHDIPRHRLIDLLGYLTAAGIFWNVVDESAPGGGRIGVNAAVTS